MKLKRSTLLLILFLTTAASAAPAIQEIESDYTIYGTNQQQLRNEMNNLGPEDNGRHFDAYTHWYVEWRFNFQNDDGLCKITTVNVSVKISYTLPYWADYSNADPALKSKWDTYMSHLRSHEQNHAEHGKQAAAEIENMLRMLPPAQDCRTLETTANAQAQQIISAYNQKDKSYDDNTQHGTTEGAVFP
jgi:predicted secreted Zn-dependent protease